MCRSGSACLNVNQNINCAPVTDFNRFDDIDPQETEEWLESIESVLAQMQADDELLVVDDGSPDGTGEWADEAAAGDQQVQVAVAIPIDQADAPTE